MPRRKDNMLEAFKASGDGAAETPSAAAPRAFEPPSAGPFAPLPLPEPERERLQAELDELEQPADIGLATFEIPIGPKAFFLALSLALVIAFFIGRYSASPLQAGHGSRTPAQVGSLEFEPAQAALPGRSSPQTPSDAVREAGAPTSGEVSEADKAFLDPANRVTIQAITYPNTRLAEEKAFETYDILRQQGFPVVTPRSRGSYLFVFVGAAPSQRDLLELQKSLQAAETPDGKLSFKDAYIVNTADYR